MKPGIHSNVPIDDYVRDPCDAPSLSSGIAHTLLARSPRHAWQSHPRLNPQWYPDEESRFDLGTAAHAVLLEGDVAKLAVLDFSDWRKKEAKQERGLARLQGKIPVLAHQAKAITDMVVEAKAFLKESELGNVLGGGWPEQTVVWQTDGATWCRCRPDWITTGNVVLSYKTTQSAEPDQWINYVALRSGYEIQAAFELYGLWEIQPEKRYEYYWLVQEIEAPYVCSLVGMTPALRDHATEKVDHAISIWRECLATGEWPGYGKRVFYAEPNNWSVAQWQERLSMEAMEAER